MAAIFWWARMQGELLYFQIVSVQIMQISIVAHLLNDNINVFVI